eukprot:1178662-Pyramimonas_sp.AAC.1
MVSAHPVGVRGPLFERPLALCRAFRAVVPAHPSRSALWPRYSGPLGYFWGSSVAWALSLDRASVYPGWRLFGASRLELGFLQ